MFHSLNGSAHRRERRLTNLPRQFGNRLLLGGVTTLGFQCETPDETDIALFGSEDTYGNNTSSYLRSFVTIARNHSER